VLCPRVLMLSGICLHVNEFKVNSCVYADIIYFNIVQSCSPLQIEVIELVEEPDGTNKSQQRVCHF
jgi:hypothetical protein